MSTADELRELRDWVRRIETTELTLAGSGVDVSREEVAIRKREISHLERILARARKG